MNYNKEQRLAIDTVDGNVAVIAVAGSGKTSVLTERILNIVNNHHVSPENILAITFSRKAKEHMIEKLKGKLNSYDSINIETFHSLAWSIIKQIYGCNIKLWKETWEKEKIITDICKDLNLYDYDDEVDFNKIMNFITKQKINMLSPSDNLIYYNGLPYKNETMKLIYKEYENYKAKNNLIEYDDFLNICCRIFEKREDILAKYKNKFKYILADEYQDVSLNQARFIEYLGKGNNVFIVGDMLQAIYSFRGGSSSYLLDFYKDWDNVKVINMNTNYRCSKNIVDTANCFSIRMPEGGYKYYVDTVAEKPYNKKPVFKQFKTTLDECKYVINKIKELSANKYDYKNIAILARTNAQLQKFEDELTRVAIPYNIVEGKSYHELPEILLLINYLSLAYNQNDDEAFKYIFNKPNRWLGKEFLNEVENNAKQKNISLFYSMFSIGRRNWRFKNGIKEIEEVIHHISKPNSYVNVKNMIKYLRKHLKLDEYLSKTEDRENDANDVTENMDSFQDTCKQFCTLEKFMRYIKDIQKSSKDESGGVQLITLHKSKGLEFPIVFIVGCSNRLLPHWKNDDIEDEKRLMYVGITRAEDELYLTHSEKYNDETYFVSPFIEDLQNTIVIEK
jgi:DNA helicase-2/ATP-dependent DNA helicase PcrA